MFKQQEAEVMTKYLYTVTGVISSIVGLGAFLFFTEKRGALQLDQSGNIIVRTPEDLYDSTIESTAFKSTMLQKLNPVRQFLHLADRPEAIKKGQYDKQVVEQVWKIDLSDLDQGFLAKLVGWHNIAKATVLTVVPFMQGLEAAPDVNLAGEDS